MTRDKIKEIMGEGVSEEQISNLLNTFHNDNNANKSKIQELEQKLQGYDDMKSQLDAINAAKMSDEEKLAEKLKNAEAKEKAANVIYNTAKAKEILSGFNIPDELIAKMVSDNETETVNAATLLKNQMSEYKDTITKNVKEQIAKLDVKPNPSNIPPGDDVMTKDKFAKMTMLEQKQWKDANLEQYREWYPQN